MSEQELLKRLKKIDSILIKYAPIEWPIDKIRMSSLKIEAIYGPVQSQLSQSQATISELREGVSKLERDCDKRQMKINRYRDALDIAENRLVLIAGRNQAEVTYINKALCDIETALKEQPNEPR